jgi:hypothetical protein
MKRNLIGILPLLLVMSLMINVTAQAQSVAQANVPFSFKVGSTPMPAGTYRVTVVGANIVSLRNTESDAAVLSTTRHEYPRKPGAELIFRHLGNQYFLAEIWTNGSSMVIPRSSQEKQLAKELQVASSQSTGGEEIMIALN